jgi:Zn finger protein HypA/HybF involved in hydrogenase expression
LKNALLTQQKIPLTKADSLQTAETHESHYAENEEFAVDCPDCFDTMVKIYDSDKFRYYCENCDLVIPKTEVEGFNE